MPAPHERTRNNLRAGVFVTLVLAAAFFVIITLGEAGTWMESTSSYTIRFTVAAGVEGVSPGSEVRVGGVRMGKVTSDPRLVIEHDRRVILVPIELDSAVTLYADATVVRTAPLLGNVAAINFASVGTAASGPLAPGSTLDAASGLGMLESFLGAESAENTRGIIDNFRKLSDRLPTDYETRFLPMIDDAGTFVTRVKDDYERWRLTIDEIMNHANNLATSLDDSAAQIRAFVADSRPDVQATIKNLAAASDDVKDVTHTVKQETVDKVHALLDRGDKALESFLQVGSKAAQWMDAEIPVLNQTLADARLTATQLKLAGIELRRAPWKLFYRPSVDELQHELLYESARSFALAGSELRAASESLDRVLSEHGQTLRLDPTVLEYVQKNLVHSFEVYERAQQQLIEVLLTPER